MQIDYDVGDCVVCYRMPAAHPRVRNTRRGIMKIGKIYRVRAIGIGPASGLLFVKFEGYEHGPLGCRADCFKKLPKASNEFTEQMRKMKPHKQKVEA